MGPRALLGRLAVLTRLGPLPGWVRLGRLAVLAGQVMLARLASLAGWVLLARLAVLVRRAAGDCFRLWPPATQA